MTWKLGNGGGRVLAQLRLLIWKNFVQQIRSPVFTAVEFIVPLLLIGITFGLMIGLRHKYEFSYSATTYQPWMVQGSAVDLIIPPDFTQIFVDTIVDTQYILTGQKQTDCIFLNVTRSAKDNNVSANIGLEIVYAPSNPEINEIMQIVQARYTSSDLLAALISDFLFTMPMAANYLPALNPSIKLKISSIAKITPKANELELVKYITESLSTTQCNNPIIGGIVFAERFARSVNTSDDIIYTIRLSNTKRRYLPIVSAQVPWNTKIKFAVPMNIGPFLANNPSGGSPGYWQEGFLTLQKAVDVAIQRYLSNETDVPALMLQRFPYPPYRNLIIEIGSFFLPTVVAFSFMINVVYITRSIVVEKETRIKSYMKVMGLSQWLLWLSYLISNLIKLLVIVVALSALYYVVTPKSDPTVALVFFSLYALNVIYIAFAISVFLESGAAAMQIVPFVWVILYAWELMFNIKDLISPLSSSIRLLNALNPDIALAYGIGFMCQYETLAYGIQWSLLFARPTPDEPLTLGHFFLMLIIDAVIFGIIAWYVEALNPGFDGVPQKPYFFVLPSYWCGKKTEFQFAKQFIRTDLSDLPNCKPDMEDAIEGVPDILRPTVDIVDLCKTYQKSLLQRFLCCSFSKKETKAVKHLYTKMYPGQITALLGQNGAGKSTTFSILTGVLQPTSGTAYIEGLDIATELPAIQTRMGLCPQHNIVFDCLTVLEHLKFFCKLKGRKWHLKEANDLLHRLNIEHKANVYGHYLSGGQKRKLSLAIALIGGSEIVMLDEPTSGMDPDARHETWSLLQDEKKVRTILLTTHYMDEADILGDRITIMAHGELQCSGSGLFLKQLYSAGYRLSVLYQKTQVSETHTKNVLQTLTLLRRFTLAPVIQSSNGFEVTFLLPAEQRHNFADLFRELEKNMSLFGISTFGVSATTMEEVFLRVCKNAAEKLFAENGVTEDEKREFSVAELKYEDRLEHGYSYYVQQFRAMFYKRFAYFFRKRTFFILELLFPAICLTLIIEALMILPMPTVQPDLPINLEVYSSRGEIANIYVQNTRAPYFQENLPQVIQEAASENAQHKYPFKLTDVDNITAALIQGLAKQKDRGFGLHNPVAYNYFANLLFHDWFVGMFNNYALHSPPLALNLADIAIVSRAIQRNISIQVSNHPLPPATTDRLKNGDVVNQPALILGFAAIMSLSAVVASFGNFVIYERTTKCKHMQMLCGLKHWIYWLTAFLWDYTIFLIPASLCVAVFYAVDLKEYITRGSVTGTLFLVMLLYAWAELPFVYFCSALFTSPTKGNATICVYNFMTGMIGAVAVSIVEKASGSDTALTLSIIWALLFPTYNLSSCFSKAYTNEYARQACTAVDCSRPEVRNIAKQCCGSERVFVDNMLANTGKMGMKLMVIFFFIHSIIFWLAVAAYEANLFGIIKRWLEKLRNSSKIAVAEAFETHIEDTDVISECERVQKMDSSDALMIVRNLEKWFGKLNAVRKINFHVEKGECFGLLGVNGAGKTTTFQMLTGEGGISAGDAFVHGYSIKTQWREACAHIGYCPQFDALIGEMTGQEALSMFARLRGVRECDVPSVVDAVVRAVAISKYQKNPIRTYSGGNKRRLSLGVALLTLPDVLLLDEPTTGVDPKASRIIWDILSKVRESGTALVLTSHSMEECEALCTQIAIMVNGEFRCLGSTQHIKSKYGNGYSLAIRLRDFRQIGPTKEMVAKMFPDSRLTDEHILHLNYELAVEKSQSWSMLFEKIEKLAHLVDAADYSISQTTLDQIFLEFSRDARADGTDLGRLGKRNLRNNPEDSGSSKPESVTDVPSTSSSSVTGATPTV